MIDLKLMETSKPCERHSDIALICGDGKTLLGDLGRFLKWGLSHDVFCIGRSIQAYPGPVGHYVDIDADNAVWFAENLEKLHPDKVENGYVLKHTLGKCKGFDVDWTVENSPWDMDDVVWHGSTALFAVLIALKMGYNRIVLAGAPLDSKGHWYFPEEVYGPKWTMETYQNWFEFAAIEQSEKVRSMSGYTKTLLGVPEKAWIVGVDV